MTDNQKENLLKLLLNKPKENPNENVPNYSDPIVFTNNVANRFSQHFEYPFYATPYRTISKDNLLICFNIEAMTILEYTSPTYMYTQASWFTAWKIIDMIADGSGYYGIVISSNRIYLMYFDDLAKKGEDNIHTLRYKMAYDITNMLVEVTGDTNPQNSAYNGAIKLHKSPMDGRFLITTSLLNQSHFGVIEYKINVGTDNTYRYQRVAMSSVTTSFPIIDDMFVSWTDSNVNYAVGIIGASSVVQSKQNFKLYEIKGDMSSIAINQLADMQDTICAPLYLKVSYTPQIRYRTMTDRYISYSIVKNTTHEEDGLTWADGEIKMDRINGTTRTNLTTTETNYMISSEYTSYKNELDIVILNGNVFGIETILTAPDKIQATFKQLIGNEIHEKVVLSNVDYSRTGICFTAISNEFNIYRYSYQVDNKLYSISSVFRPSGYNGTAYFDENCLNAESGQLYDVTNSIVFARDLYNKSIVGDTINSTIHVPASYLNENPIIKEDLISKTNMLIEEGTQEIVKNEYEELYISFVDAIKVWDKNDKSTYQQNASYQLAKQLNEGVRMYVANFRITNKDNSIVQGEIGEIPIVNGEGVFEISFQVPSGGAKSFEIFDKDYEIQFANIDLSNVSPGAYKLTEKVKVEG